MEFGARLTLLAEPFGNVGADRFRCPANLIAKRILLDLWKGQAAPMNRERHSIRTFEDLKIFERTHRFRVTFHLMPDP